MPLMLAPIVPFALRLGAVAAAAYAAKHLLAGRIHKGRTDQRSEDALDDLAEGVAMHRLSEQTECRQSNTSLRVKRIIRWGKAGLEIDAAFLGRFRIRKL